MNKRGQGLTLNTIVIAALVVIVLIVLILIFTGNLGIFQSQTNDCATQGGSCHAATSCPDGMVTKFGAICPKASNNANQICCIGVLE